MKHYNRLMQIEEQVIRLEEMRNLLAVIGNGLECSTETEIASAVHYIEGSIADISEQLSENFKLLFNEIREET